MKKNGLKTVAALVAAMMICSVSALAFAAEEDVKIVEDNASDMEVVESAEIVADEDVFAELEGKTADVATGSSIKIGTIQVTERAVASSPLQVKVPFVCTGDVTPEQLMLFVYDISSIAGDQNNEVDFVNGTTTQIFARQVDGQLVGSFIFYIREQDASKKVMVVKIGGTNIDVADAKSFTLLNSGIYECGDVNHDDDVNAVDALAVMREAFGMDQDGDFDETLADTYHDGSIDAQDARYIMLYAFHVEGVDSLPVEPE